MGTDAREKLVARLKAKVERRRQEAAVKSVATSGTGWKRQTFVRVSNFEFVPNCVVVLRGASVTWTCCSQDSLLGPEVETHRIKFKDPRFPCSEDLRSGESFTLTFDQPGVYPYYCANYNFVMGWVKVLEDQPAQRKTTDVSPEELERLAQELSSSSSSNNNNNNNNNSNPSTCKNKDAQHQQSCKRRTKAKRPARKTLHRIDTSSSAGPEDSLSAAVFSAKLPSSPSSVDNTCSATEASTDFEEDHSEKKSQGSSHVTALAALEDFHDLDDSDHDHDDHDEEDQGRDTEIAKAAHFDDADDLDASKYEEVFAGLDNGFGADVSLDLLDEQRRLEEAIAAAAAEERQTEWIDAPRRKRRNRRHQSKTDGEDEAASKAGDDDDDVREAEDEDEDETAPKTICGAVLPDEPVSNIDRKALCDLLEQKWNEAI